MTQWIKYKGYPDDYFDFSIYTWSFIIIWLSIPLLYIIYGRIIYIRKVYKKRLNQKLTSDVNEVVIVVLGDLGHSPRMAYHAKSFQKIGYHVNICGYLESDLPSFLLSPDISIYDIPVIKNKKKLPYLLFAALKVSSQIVDMTMLLKDLLDDSTRFVLIQNPPSLPVLLIIGLLKKFWAPNVQLVIDWHNLNWSILNLKYQNENHPVVKFMKYYEKLCSSAFADFNLTVTAALKKYLVDEFNIDNDKILTLYDRPSTIFEPLDSQDTLHKVIQKNNTLFGDGSYNQLTDRILITSTSFTPDEDFTILVDSLISLENRLEAENSKSNITMIVTGKGPLQSKFLELIKSKKWSHIRIKNAWLPIEEYPNVLKIADLGISLHYSSSGLDLPMKIVDLFGSGVPVISMSYPVINELVKDRFNGIILKDNKDGDEMANIIYDILFCDRKLYLKIKQGALIESQRKWDNEWNEKLSDLFSLASDSKI